MWKLFQVPLIVSLLFTVPLHLWNQSTTDCSTVYLLLKNICVYKWTHTVQNRVFQGSTVYECMCVCMCMSFLEPFGIKYDSSSLKLQYAFSEIKNVLRCSVMSLCEPMDYTVHGILQARILECVTFPFSGGSSQPRAQTQVSWTAGGFFTSWATREALD